MNEEGRHGGGESKHNMMLGGLHGLSSRMRLINGAAIDAP
jgi:hypothetical protein